MGGVGWWWWGGGHQGDGDGALSLRHLTNCRPHSAAEWVLSVVRGPRRFLTGREWSSGTEEKTNTKEAEGVRIRRYTSTPPPAQREGLEPLRVGRGGRPSVIVPSSVPHVPDVLTTLRYSWNHQLPHHHHQWGLHHPPPFMFSCPIATKHWTEIYI